MDLGWQDRERKKQGGLQRNPGRDPWVNGRCHRPPGPFRRRERGWAYTRGRTGSSPVHPFGSLATISPQTKKCLAQWPKAHSFAPPLFNGFALSRMKGVTTQAGRRSPPPGWPPKLATLFAAQLYVALEEMSNAGLVLFGVNGTDSSGPLHLPIFPKVPWTMVPWGYLDLRQRMRYIRWPLPVFCWP